MGSTELGILREINGRNSIEEVALACRLPLFHTLHFIFSGLDAGLFELRRPTSTEIVIPGFSQGAWRTLVREAEKALAAGDLQRAQRQLSELRRRHTEQREANELAAGIEGKILQALDARRVEDDAVLELAVPPAQLVTLQCSPEEGFLLSRVNGVYSMREIIRQMPGSELETRVMVDRLIRERTLRLKGPTSQSSRDRRVG
jgi:hypothetical protein